MRWDVRVRGDEHALITLAKNLAGWGVEIPETSLDKGGGRTLPRDVLAAWIAGQALFCPLVPLIKMIKCWNRANGNLFRSFHLEVLVRHVLE